MEMNSTLVQKIFQELKDDFRIKKNPNEMISKFIRIIEEEQQENAFFLDYLENLKILNRESERNNAAVQKLDIAIQILLGYLDENWKTFSKSTQQFIQREYYQAIISQCNSDHDNVISPLFFLLIFGFKQTTIFTSDNFEYIDIFSNILVQLDGHNISYYTISFLYAIIDFLLDSFPSEKDKSKIISLIYPYLVNKDKLKTTTNACFLLTISNIYNILWKILSSYKSLFIYDFLNYEMLESLVQFIPYYMDSFKNSLKFIRNVKNLLTVSHNQLIQDVSDAFRNFGFYAISEYGSQEIFNQYLDLYSKIKIQINPGSDFGLDYIFFGNKQLLKEMNEFQDRLISFTKYSITNEVSDKIIWYKTIFEKINEQEKKVEAFQQINPFLNELFNKESRIPLESFEAQQILQNIQKVLQSTSEVQLNNLDKFAEDNIQLDFFQSIYSQIQKVYDANKQLYFFSVKEISLNEDPLFNQKLVDYSHQLLFSASSLNEQIEQFLSINTSKLGTQVMEALMSFQNLYPSIQNAIESTNVVDAANMLLAILNSEGGTDFFISNAEVITNHINSLKRKIDKKEKIIFQKIQKSPSSIIEILNRVINNNQKPKLANKFLCDWNELVTKYLT